MKSREVFIDCMKAKEMLKYYISQGSISESKILWFSCITLLRVIGHVLEKVDGKNSSKEFQSTLKLKYNEWKTLPLFKDFIEEERNKILKEYESNITEILSERSSHVYNQLGEPMYSAEGKSVYAMISITELVKSKGFFQGESPVQVLEKALDWWDKELKILENIK